MNIYKMNDDGFWDFPRKENGYREGGNRGRCVYQVSKKISLPKTVRLDLFNALRGLSDREPARIPDYVLASFGLFRENYPNEEVLAEALFDFMYEKTGSLGFDKNGDMHFDVEKNSDVVHIWGQGINLPYFARIFATVLKHHGFNFTFVFEAARLEPEEGWTEEDVFGGETLVIKPGIIGYMGTEELAMQICEEMNEELKNNPEPGMQM